MTKSPARLRVMMIGAYSTSPDRLNGGVAAATTYLSQALAIEPGVDLVGVRIAREPSTFGQPSDFGFPIVDIPLGRLSLSTLYRRQLSQLRQLIHEHRPDIVHGQGTDIAGYLAVSSGMPSVVTVHGLLGECAKYQTDRVTRLRARLTALLTEHRTVRRARELIAVSPYVTRYYQNEITGRVHDIPNAIAPSFFDVTRQVERGRLLYAGRIAHGKGLLDLLRAVARSPSSVSQLVVAGAAPDRAYEQLVRDEIAGLGLASRVRLTGLLSERELLQEFARAEALVLPSYQETAPMVIQQAMAAGLAVIATGVGGIPHQIQHGETGLLFTPGDIDGLSNLICRLGDDKSLGGRLGESARARAVKYYRATAVARATRAAYEATLSRGESK